MAHQLTIPIEQSVVSTSTITGQFLRAQTEQALRDLPFFERIGADRKNRSLLLDAMTKMPLPGPIAFQLTLAYEVRPELFRHSIFMAIIAAWMTQGLMVSRFDLSVATAAGLLHDIGMLHVDPILLTPQSFIGGDQMRQLYSHPLISTVLIERHHEYPRELLRAVKEHHDFLDGSGYPSHLGEQAISPLGRILSLSEVVASTLASEHGVAELRLGVLLRMNRRRYDDALVERVMQALEPQNERQNEVIAVTADPVSQLLAMETTLADCSADLAERMNLSGSRPQSLTDVTEQAAQLRRTLATVGAAPQQLAQLGTDTLDNSLQLELTLLAREAAWQLRSLARQARRRWQCEPDALYPDDLQAWLDRMDKLVANINNTATVPLYIT